MLMLTDLLYSEASGSGLEAYVALFVPLWMAVMEHLPPLKILYEDNHLLAVVKPAGIPTMGAPSGSTTMLELCKRYLKIRDQKPGNVYLGIVSRLDKPVSGVLLLAKTSKAARRLTEQFRRHAVEKIYWALVEGEPEHPSGQLRDYLVRERAGRPVAIASEKQPGGQMAETHFRLLARGADASLLELRPTTGRKHQLRVQLAGHGMPIVGDSTYGSRQKFPVGIALHARQLVLFHPVKDEELILVAELPEYWRKHMQKHGISWQAS